jgi:glycosyltransferase involved in cell wall biosynthesis
VKGETVSWPLKSSVGSLMLFFKLHPSLFKLLSPPPDAETSTSPAARGRCHQGYDGLVTLDCDGQHEPQRIPRFIEAAKSVDIVSGSRYLKQYEGDSQPPQQRLFINRRITAQLNERLGLKLTDAFCGFKAYRSEALRKLQITDTGYAMPLQLWVEAAAAGLSIMEIPVPLIYLDLDRSFGGSLDDAETRLRYYNQVIDQSLAAVCADGRVLSTSRKTFCQNSPG